MNYIFIWFGIPKPQLRLFKFAAFLCFVVSGGPRGRPSKGPLREGLAHGVGPGPRHEGIDSYSAQGGINSKGNVVDI